MSYTMSVDPEDFENSCQINSLNGTSRRNHLLGHNNPGFLTLINRVIRFRRLRILKVYMAIIVIFLMFLLIFNPFSTKTESTVQAPDHLIVNDEQISEQKPPLSRERAYSRQAKEQPTTYRRNKSRGRYGTTFKEPIRHPTNFTYTLSMDDFSRMKGINDMQIKIREATKHSWDSYKRYAWGFDMLKPHAKEPDHWFDLGLTIVDGVDTLIMMGLKNEAEHALDWMENELNFKSRNENSNCFELTIRILGGLLSATHLSGREKLKNKSIEFGNILLHCYDTESKIIPYSDIDLATQKAHPPPWNPHSSLSEVTSLQLEFRFLSQLSGDNIYEQTSFQTNIHIHNLTLNRNQKLLPMYINPVNGQLEDSVITLGARSDSYYEYLLKQYLQTGIKWLEDDYLDSMDEVQAKLLRYTNGIENYTYVAEIQIYQGANNTEDLKYFNKMDHLVCFLPGTLALGYYHFSPQAAEFRLKFNLETPIAKLNSRYDKHLQLSEALARTCYHMYSNMGTGLAPEIASFVHSQTNNPSGKSEPEISVQSNAAHNILRPEFVESLFYLYHITGLPMYRNQAAQIFEAFQKYSRIATGYSAISDVRNKPAPGADLDELLHKNAPDRMESFWISETLKYLYLTFCDDKHVVGTLLNNYVFNTEAHLVPLF